MKQEITILLVEDDVQACEELKTCIASTEGMRLIGITNNAESAQEVVLSQLPDMILLDLELHEGGGNGLQFLYNLNRMQIPFRPYIVVTTHTTSEVTFASARKLGADFILAKYEQGYSAQYVVDFILAVKDTVLSEKARNKSEKPALSPSQMEYNVRQRIQREMTIIGISPKALGFTYLSDAIYRTMQKPETNIAQSLSEKYGKSPASIERAMQNAINHAWHTNDPEELLKNYTARIRADRGVPTMMEFIHYYATKIKMELEIE